MMTLGPIGFLEPLVLSALVALPAIWWLLRLTPPRPQYVVFPPTRLLKGLEDSEKTSAHSPWWLTLLRMIMAALLILALAGPVLNPDRDALQGSGPVVLVVDNGWASASQWHSREANIEAYISRAERDSRPILLTGTAGAREARLETMSPQKAREAAATLRPQPYKPERLRLAARLETEFRDKGPATFVWLSDGLDYGNAKVFAERLGRAAGDETSLSVALPEAGAGALGLRASAGEKGALVAEVIRAENGARAGSIRAFTARGEQLGEVDFSIEPSAKDAQAIIDLPLEIRNQVARIEIAGEASAGGVHLLDARSRWRRVGIISGETRELAQPLLSPLYYVQRALSPYSEIVSAPDSNIASSVSELLARDLSVLILADIGQLVDSSLESIQSWVNRGGTLVRFAGPRLEKSGDGLLPTVLRRGGRTLGGSLSWSTPQPLAPFEESSPFSGLVAPEDVTVRRQVLSDPAAGVDAEVWARLKDGTPLVSAAKRGEGRIVLFHITANSDWSNLPISGLFVEMLKRITERSVITSGEESPSRSTPAANASPAAAPATGLLAPREVLDGFGRLVSPPASVTPVEGSEIDTLEPDASHPPGYYGPAGSARSLNVISASTKLTALGETGDNATRIGYEVQKAVQLKPWLMGAAMILFLADMIAVLAFAIGPTLMAIGRRSAAAILVLAIATSMAASGVMAQQTNEADDKKFLEASLSTRLAYVLTGDGEIDQVSEIGLSGLSRVLKARTAIEPAEPVGVNVDTDELAFYPLLYWPVPDNASRLSEKTLAKIDAYMKQGGMIIFDTRDYHVSLPAGRSLQGVGTNALSKLVGSLDVPPLEPVPENHVLTKAFYLLKSFPGRWDGGALWVEASPRGDDEQARRANRTDGVSSILITSNDLAAAWALDKNNRAIYPVVPGGDVQREMAFRVGVNIVMYALTGNYKADQVHVPALLERLGQ